MSHEFDSAVQECLSGMPAEVRRRERQALLESKRICRFFPSLAQVGDGLMPRLAIPPAEAADVSWVESDAQRMAFKLELCLARRPNRPRFAE
jgi:hypothetical protein